MPVDPPASPSPTPPASPPPASPPADPFAGIKLPDKFVKDGKPDLGSFVNAYGELETRFLTKTEQLKAEIAAESLKNRPESADKYALPALEGVDQAELGKHPMVEWWRQQAFEAGIPQDKFEAGVKQYIETMGPQEIPEETLKAELGEAFKTRIAAVDAWAQATAKSPGELAALQAAATSPDGIKIFERLMGLGTVPDGGGPVPPEKTLDLDTLRSMQQDPRYWDPAQRDVAFIKTVEQGYAKLYPEKKAG